MHIFRHPGCMQTLHKESKRYAFVRRKMTAEKRIHIPMDK